MSEADQRARPREAHADDTRDAAENDRRRWGWRLRWRRWRRRKRRRGLWRGRRTAVCERDEVGLRAVEDVLVARELDRLVRPLPERVRAPTERELAHRLAPTRDPERDGRSEAWVVARAGLPPVRRRVDHGPAAGQRLVLGDEAREPRDHRRLAQAIAGRSIRVVLDV